MRRILIYRKKSRADPELYFVSVHAPNYVWYSLVPIGDIEPSHS